jgi:tRNA(Ile)-lysidine synthase
MKLKPRKQEQWELRFKAKAKADGWWRQGSSVVAAVSGGPDSMALLHLLKTMAEEEPFTLVVAHANHQFRGSESEEEARMVVSVAEEWGIPVETAELGLPAYIAETGMNAQAAAREKRYGFLKEVAHRHSCSAILLGHHADDQAETVLMRFIRGSGPGALAGMAARRKEEDLELIRPLLRITKCELLDYCKRNEVPYSVDSSNADRHYFRNAVRLDLIPLLESYNPQLRASLVRLADMAAAEDDYMQEATLSAFKEAVRPEGEGYRLELGRFGRLHVALQRRLIKLILSCSSEPRQTPDFLHIEEIVEVLSDQHSTVIRLEIGNGWEMRREYEEAYIGPFESAAGRFSCVIHKTTREISIKETGERLLVNHLEGSIPLAPGDRYEAAFDGELIRYPLELRSRLPGDFMQPYGLNGTKKVQDMFVDAKVPRSRRDSIPILVDGDGRILWIPGIRRSSHALVTESTRSTLHFVLARSEN